MVRSSFSTLFFIRENRVRKDGTTIIEVLITVNGERCGFSTGKKVKATSWDKTKQQVKGKDEEAKSLNNYLKAVKANCIRKKRNCWVEVLSSLLNFYVRHIKKRSNL